MRRARSERVWDEMRVPFSLPLGTHLSRGHRNDDDDDAGRIWLGCEGEPRNASDKVAPRARTGE